MTLSAYLFALVMDEVTRDIQGGTPWCMLFADDVVSTDENRTRVDQKLELWRPMFSSRPVIWSIGEGNQSWLGRRPGRLGDPGRPSSCPVYFQDIYIYIMRIFILHLCTTYVFHVHGPNQLTLIGPIGPIRPNQAEPPYIKDVARVSRPTIQSSSPPPCCTDFLVLGARVSSTAQRFLHHAVAPLPWMTSTMHRCDELNS
jgi:hypothetical protein